MTMSTRNGKTEQAGPKQGFAARLDSNKFARGHPEAWKFIKSLFFGMVTAGPGVVAYMVLCPLLTKSGATLPDFWFFNILAANMRESVEYTIPALVYAFIASTFLGQSLAFIPNRKLAFRADANAALSTFLMVLLALFTILANGIVGPAIATVVFKMNALSDALLNFVSKVISMAATVAWCYPVNRFVIHRVRKEKEDRT